VFLGKTYKGEFQELIKGGENMTPVEIMALIVALLATIKILVIMHNPKNWIGVVEKVYSNPAVMTVVGLVLAAVSLFYLLEELTIVQIFAAMLFFMLLSLMGIAAFSKDVMAMEKKLLKDKAIIKKAWLAFLVWVLLIIWVLVTLF
tara:strand:- start:77 stop:514 length:438 start_codon:yes stop_codon:yes gene_type:complete